MSREYGRIMSQVWRDPDWRTLTMDEQHTYLMLITQGDISSAGVLGVTVRRWATYASDADLDVLSKALVGLAAKHFIVVDDDTEELLVRKFVKYDGGWNNWKRLKAIRSAAKGVTSPILAQVIAQELKALGLSDSPSDSASHSPSDSASDGTSEGLSHRPRIQDSGFRIQDKGRVNQKGSRLAADWEPTEADLKWLHEKGITTAKAAKETEKFRNHFAAKAGKDGSKLDWSATWKNWQIRAEEFTPSPRSGGAAAVESWMSVTPKPKS